MRFAEANNIYCALHASVPVEGSSSAGLLSLAGANSASSGGASASSVSSGSISDAGFEIAVDDADDTDGSVSDDVIGVSVSVSPPAVDADIMVAKTSLVAYTWAETMQMLGPMARSDGHMNSRSNTAPAMR